MVRQHTVVITRTRDCNCSLRSVVESRVCACYGGLCRGACDCTCGRSRVVVGVSVFEDVCVVVPDVVKVDVLDVVCVLVWLVV